MSVQRLTAAYRSRPRPSSAPGAKASTVCPYYLDGELRLPVRRQDAKTTDTRRRPWVNTLLTLDLGAVFKLRRGRQRGSPAGGLSKLSSVFDGLMPSPASRSHARQMSGRHLENVSLERR